MKLNAEQLRDLDPEVVQTEVNSLKRNPIYLILENVYDTYNIGGLFRLADALAVEKMYLCGEMETPPNSRILKASIGTYKVVPWEYKQTAHEAIAELRAIKGEQPVSIYAVEQSTSSVHYQEVEYSGPVGLILGNETYGVLPETMALVDKTVEIPMWGINKSLNVIVSAAIVSYWVVGKILNRESESQLSAS